MYCKVIGVELAKLYEAVQDGLSAFYKELNETDETFQTDPALVEGGRTPP